MTTTTSIRLDTKLLKRAKQYALDHDITLADIVRDGIIRVIGEDVKTVQTIPLLKPSLTTKLIINKESIPFD